MRLDSTKKIVVTRSFAALMALAILLFLVDNTLLYWFDWPGIHQTLSHLGILQTEKPLKPLSSDAVFKGVLQVILFLSSIFIVLFSVCRNSQRSLTDDSVVYTNIAAFITLFAFWTIFLIGLVDMTISFLRVENILPLVVSDQLNTQLGRSIFRGSYIHFPIILISLTIACFSRGLGFIWLALLIVVAEFTIVVTRFVFSYEQAFMGDLVRFWYAGLFLFSSAYTLLHDGHVRVDVLYANLGERGKALVNAIGALILGIPLCWNILIQGTDGKGSIINSPLLSFEISQNGFGMYVKYLMAGYLLVFATSMAIQFIALMLKSTNTLLNKPQGITA